MMRTFFITLASLFHIPLVARPDEAYIQAAHEHAKHVEARNEPWEWKQRQVLRALQNTFKSAPVRDLNLAIEIVVQERCLVSK